MTEPTPEWGMGAWGMYTFWGYFGWIIKDIGSMSKTTYGDEPMSLTKESTEDEPMSLSKESTNEIITL